MFLNLFLSITRTSQGSCSAKSVARIYSKMKTWWCTPSSTSLSLPSPGPRGAPSPSTARRLPAPPASCGSVKPSSESPSQKCTTSTRGSLTSITSTGSKTRCTRWTTPRGAAVAAPSCEGPGARQGPAGAFLACSTGLRAAVRPCCPQTAGISQPRRPQTSRWAQDQAFG